MLIFKTSFFQILLSHIFLRRFLLRRYFLIIENIFFSIYVYQWFIQIFNTTYMFSEFFWSMIFKDWIHPRLTVYQFVPQLVYFLRYTIMEPCVASHWVADKYMVQRPYAEKHGLANITASLALHTFFLRNKSIRDFLQ